VELEAGAKLSLEDEDKLKWILKNPQENDNLHSSPSLVASSSTQKLFDVGPRFNFSTPDSTNSVSICHSAQLTAIKRIEVSVRYLVTFVETQGADLSAQDEVSEFCYQNLSFKQNIF
jgi:phosphoribosylformylglycinamidine synthase